MVKTKSKVERLRRYSRPTYKVTGRYGDEYEYQQYVPAGRRPARTIRGALVNTLDVLEDEGHWMKKEWFKNKNPYLDPDDAFCNSWKACLQSIIGLVTVGAVRKAGWTNYKWDFDSLVREDAPNYQLYVDTVEHVESLLGSISIPRFNDRASTRRADVIELVKRAIKSAPKTK